MSVVKIRANRQITIPKRIFDDLGLKEGEFVDVIRNEEMVVVKPRVSVDPGNVLTAKQKERIDERLAEGLKDIEDGRVFGPFETVEMALRALQAQSP